MNPTPVQEELVHPSTRSRICAALEASVEMEFAPLGEVVWVSNSLLSSRSRLCLMPATSRPASKGGRSAGHGRGWLITDEGRGALRGGGHLAALNEIVAPSPEPHRLWGGRAHGMMNLPVTLADELSQIS